MRTPLYVALLAAGCACNDSSLATTGQLPTPGSPTPATTATSETEDNTYTTLFSGFPGHASGGLSVGSTNNLRFALDLQTKLQIINPPPGYAGNYGQVTPKIKVSSELGSYCGQPTLVEPGSLKLDPGDKAWVERLDLTMASTSAIPDDGGPPEDENANKLCFGYRNGDTWTWKLQPQVAAWDKSLGKYVISLAIQAGPIDAIKVLFNNGFGAKRLLEKMVLVAKPVAGN